MPIGMCVEQRRLTPPAGAARDERTAPQGHEDGVRRVPHALVARGELHSPVAPRAYVDRIGNDLDDFIHGMPILR